MRQTEDTPVIPLDASASATGDDGAAANPLVAGMEVARRLEASADLAERARRYAKRGKKGDARRRARRQLKKLVGVLRDTQESVLSAGVTAEARAEQEQTLDTLDDTLRQFLDRKPKKKVLQQVALTAKLARKSL